MTLTKLVLLVMLIAVFVIAGRIWWTLRTAERRQRALRPSGHRNDPTGRFPDQQ